MRFYDRQQEVDFLRETREQAKTVARFTVLTGRRRIGKTTLIREAYKDESFVYFFVSRKAEAMLRTSGAFKDYEIGYEGLYMEEM